MICFRDKTFCSQKICQNAECGLRITEGIVSAATKCGLLISMTDYKDSEQCPGYIETCRDNADETSN